VYRDRSIHVVSWAKRFLFEADQLELPVSRLSGGEQARILISRLMLQPADILLLDEPTNDLDIPSLEVLEESLLDFPGAIVLVTHDRFLLDRLATSVLGFNGKGDVIHYADCNQWIADQEAEAQKIKSPKDKKGQEKPKVKKLSYKEQQELKKIERNIEKAELEVENHQEQLLKPDIASNPEKLQECYVLLQASQKKVEQLYERWAELEATNAL
ncbi:ATP-binding cassette domain-containing protein, partial [bacterium]|nr:ATP-binding cassette domain-containing protein [bacterium]